jgi:GntR family transcriptional regulator
VGCLSELDNGWVEIGQTEDCLPIPPTGAEIASDIKRKIAKGVPGYRSGDEIPTTRELAEQYGVSTATVFRAIATLRAQGLLIGRKGRGVFVAEG